MSLTSVIVISWFINTSLVTSLSSTTFISIFKLSTSRVKEICSSAIESFDDEIWTIESCFDEELSSLGFGRTCLTLDLLFFDCYDALAFIQISSKACFLSLLTWNLTSKTILMTSQYSWIATISNKTHSLISAHNPFTNLEIVYSSCLEIFTWER